MSITVIIVPFTIKAPGDTTIAITQIQMVCTKEEVTHKELHGNHFGDKIIR